MSLIIPAKSKDSDIVLGTVDLYESTFLEEGGYGTLYLWLPYGSRYQPFQVGFVVWREHPSPVFAYEAEALLTGEYQTWDYPPEQIDDPPGGVLIGTYEDGALTIHEDKLGKAGRHYLKPELARFRYAVKRGSPPA